MHHGKILDDYHFEKNIYNELPFSPHWPSHHFRNDSRGGWFVKNLNNTGMRSVHNNLMETKDHNTE